MKLATVIVLLLLASIAGLSQVQQGFDFRNTAGFVRDAPGNSGVLQSTAYQTKANGITFGWAVTEIVYSRDRSISVDPRLAGINFVRNGAPATFYVDLPPGSYNVALALGDEGYQQCWTVCQVQLLDGSTVLASVVSGPTNA